MDQRGLMRGGEKAMRVILTVKRRGKGGGGGPFLQSLNSLQEKGRVSSCRMRNQETYESNHKHGRKVGRLFRASREKSDHFGSAQKKNP